jgi:hypothetical protein
MVVVRRLKQSGRTVTTNQTSGGNELVQMIPEGTLSRYDYLGLLEYTKQTSGNIVFNISTLLNEDRLGTLYRFN